jgi:hypothetical protein
MSQKITLLISRTAASGFSSTSKEALTGHTPVL